MRLFVAVQLALLPWLAAAQGTAVVRHGPTLGSSVAVEGSIQMLSGEPIVLAGAGVTNDLLVPGTPRVSRVRTISVGPIIVGSGASTPSGYAIWTAGSGRIGRLVTKTDPVDLPLVFAPRPSTGSRSVVVTTEGQDVGLWATLKDLSIGADCGDFAVPAGTYGAFSVSSGSRFTLGTAGAATPDVYEFQSLTLDGTAGINVLGPVVLHVGGSVAIGGTVGSAGKPEWLRLNLAAGAFSVSGSGVFTGVAVVPAGTVTISGSGRIEGGLYCDRLVTSEAAVLALGGGGGMNLPPLAESKVLELAAGESLSVAVGGSDPEGGAVSFRWLDTPSRGTLAVIGSNGTSQTVRYAAGSSAGEEVLRFAVIDNLGASAVGTLTTRIIGTDGTFGRCAGLVREATTLQPMLGVTVRVVDGAGSSTTGEEGTYSVIFGGFGDFATRYATVEFSAPGYITTVRKVVAHLGVESPVEPVFLKKYDAKITQIGTTGGVATSLAGDVMVEFPAGAVSQTIGVQLTNYNAERELPGFLPKSSAFTYAVDLAPDGASFSQPVTVKVANILGFAAGTPIPVGVFNPVTVRWEPESMGVISDDGLWVVCQVTHFSSRDLNVPPKPDKPDDTPDPEKKKNEDLENKKKKDPGVFISDGTYETDFTLPALTVLNRPWALRFGYRSEQASGRLLLPVTARTARMTQSPDAREVRIQLGAQASQATYKGESATEYGSFNVAQVVDVSHVETGFARVNVDISHLYHATYATTSVFGGSPIESTSVAAREPDRRTASIPQWITPVNRTNSPFGAGWSLDGLDQVRFTPDGLAAVWVGGNGDTHQFKYSKYGVPPATLATFANGINQVSPAADGGVLVAHSRGITRVGRNGQLATVFDGVAAGLWSEDIVGVVGAVEAQTGTLYYIFNSYSLSYGEPPSPYESGLYRLTLGSSAPELIAGGFSWPDNLVIDSRGYLYVQDNAGSDVVVWKIDEAGARTRFAWGYHDYISYDHTRNFLVLSESTRANIYRPNGDLIRSIDLGDVADRIMTPFFIDGNGDIVAGVSKWNYGGPGVSGSEYFWAAWDMDGNYLGNRGPYSNPNDIRDLTRNDLGDLWGRSGDNVVCWTEARRTEFTAGFACEGTVRYKLDPLGEGWVITDPELNFVEFDAEGRVVQRGDRFGNTVLYSYLANGNLAGVELPGGGNFAFQYDSKGHLRSVADSSGRTTTVAVNGAGDLEKVIYPDGVSRSYEYGANHWLVRKVDPRGNPLALAVAANGTYKKITFPDLSEIQFAAARVQAAAAADPIAGVVRSVDDPTLPPTITGEAGDAVTDPLGHVTTWKLDDNGRAKVYVGGAGDTYAQTADVRGRVTSVEDGEGNFRSVTYLDTGSVAAVHLPGPSSPTYRFGYEPSFNQIASVEDPNGHLTAFGYDALGRLVRKVLPDGGAYAYTYNDRGQVLSETDPLGRTSTFAYDLSGNLLGHSDPLGATTTLSRDQSGRVVRSTDPLGRVTTFEYDLRDRVTRVIDSSGAATRYGYDEAGNRTSVTDALGRITSYSYDNMGSLVKVVAPDGSTTTNEYVTGYDGKRLLVATTDPNGHTRRYSYDGSTRLVSVTDPVGNKITSGYDRAGNRISVVDGKGRKTVFAYDELNRLTSTTAPDGGIVRYTYDPVGNRTSLVDPNGQATAWTYDPLGRVLTDTDPAGEVRTFAYDLAGQLSSEVNRRGTAVTYTYDRAGRRTSLSSLGQTDTMTYDLAGQLATATNNQGTITRTYDGLGRMLREQQVPGAITYTYDAVGNRTSMTDAVGTTTYGYDPLQRLAVLTDPSMRAFDFVYDAGSRLTGVGYPNGVTAISSYDTADRLLSIKHLLGDVEIAGASYTYDAANNRTSEAREDALARSFGYDLNDRVASASSNAPAEVPSESFTYDKTGNWTISGRVHDATNALTDDGFYTYSYDADGNLIEKRSKTDLGNVTTYAWDALNRLYYARTPTTEVRIRYDALGRRVQKTETTLAGGATHTVRYLYDGSNVRLELDGNGTVLAANTSAGLDRMLEREDYQTGSTHFLHADGLGSTIALTGGTGEVTERYRYSVYGELSVLSADFGPLSSAPQVAYTYTGRDWEASLELYYNRARYYSPDMGRFINRDPIGFAGGMNLFEYGNSNPVCYVDPLGLTAKGAALGAVIGGGVGAWVGGILGGTGGAVGGTFVAPGVGTLVVGGLGATEGAVVGGTVGVAVGAWLGNIISDAFDSEEADAGYKPKVRDLRPDVMGGEDSDPSKGKLKRGTPEWEKMRRELEDLKKGSGRGGKDNVENANKLDGQVVVPIDHDNVNDDESNNESAK